MVQVNEHELFEREGQSRRKYPRRAFLRSIGVLHAGQYSMAKGHEIGEGGLAFLMNESLQVDALLVLNFQIPNGEFVSTICEIKSVRPAAGGQFIHGCLFRSIKFEFKREIRTYVSARE